MNWSAPPQKVHALVRRPVHLSCLPRASRILGSLGCLGCVTAALAQVTLTDNGPSATLANGIVSVVINKSDGKCIDLRKVGGPNLLANGGQIYFDANGSVDGAASAYLVFTPETHGVVTNTPQLVEVMLTDTNLAGFQVGLHYVLRAGDSGLYVFTTWRHGPGDPAAVFDQSRMVIRCDPNLFTRAYSSPGKTGQMIEPALLGASPQIMDATYQLPQVSSYTNETGFTHDGFPVYTKYDWSAYMENHTVHGVAGDAYGIWMLMGSVEYFNGGPTKANQKVHGTETTPVILWVFHGQHFGSSPIRMDADESWTKINGPYFIYVNSGTSASALWADARDKAVEEQQAWPYTWMDHVDYPIGRGTVTGRLHVAGESTSNALVVLAQPGAYWQLQAGTNYQFWTRAGADGSFTIPKVRPGNYALFAHVPGAVGIMEQPGVTATAGQTNDVGVIDWNPPRYERRLFRLGTPDLGAGEFRFGSGMRQYGLWWRYLEEQGTNDLDFVMGQSVPSNDWYYALSLLPIDITPTNGIWFSPRWNIHFVTDDIPRAPARLKVELAGAVGGCAFYVFVNGHNICPNPSTGIYTMNDSGIVRSAVRSALQQSFELVFDPNLLVVGTNTVSFTVRATGASGNPWTGTKPVYPRAGILFDCVQLEAGDLGSVPNVRFDRAFIAGSTVSLVGSGGLPGAMYVMRASSDVEASFGLWTPVATNRFDGRGNFSFTETLTMAAASNFYRLEVP